MHCASDWITHSILGEITIPSDSPIDYDMHCEISFYLVGTLDVTCAM